MFEKKRKNLLYFSISLITEHVDLDIKLCKNTKVLEDITKKINVIYKQIKKNEIRPETDYLFNNSMTNNNLEKTINKLEKMNALAGFTPRE